MQHEANDFVSGLISSEFDDSDDSEWTPETQHLYSQMTYALDQGRYGNWKPAGECVKNLRSQERNDMADIYGEYVHGLKVERKQQAERFEREHQTQKEARKQVQLELFEEVT